MARRARDWRRCVLEMRLFPPPPAEPRANRDFEYRLRSGGQLTGLLSLSQGAAWLLVASLTLAPAPVRNAPRTDLDSFSDERLDRDLQAELNAVLKHHRPDETGDVATMQDEIMEALSDDSDEGDAGEISFADLEAEMHEDHTTVADVVHAALEHLDQASLRRSSFHLAAWNGAARGPGKRLPKYGLAVRDVKRNLIREIRAAK